MADALRPHEPVLPLPTLCLVQAAGSSLLAKLSNILVADALRLAGMGDLRAVTVLPLATGMAMTCVLLAIAQGRCVESHLNPLSENIQMLYFWSKYDPLATGMAMTYVLLASSKVRCGTHPYRNGLKGEHSNLPERAD